MKFKDKVRSWVNGLKMTYTVAHDVGLQMGQEKGQEMREKLKNDKKEQ